MTTEASAPTVTRIKEAEFVITVRVAYHDGVVHYLEVRGCSNGEDAIQVARQHAELDRPGTGLYTATVFGVNDHDRPGTT